MSRWKITSQKSVLKEKYFDVRRIDFKTETGKGKIHHIVERSPIVSVFPLTDSYEIYLISQYRYTLNKIALEAVAGHVEEKETVIDAAKRELKEETGIIADQLEEIARIEMSGSVFKSKAHLFLAKGLEIGDNDLEESEEITLQKMSLSKAVEKVMSGEINHATSMIGILLLDKLRSQKKL
ncbi:MAG: NUDIX hydrolase [Candidatus Levybacteria bacterium]|nr:NUDIX hydrolase [Candidatus Levybacteria bacterium]